ncbi:MAG TPA: Vms1/Ankzf1 family peptidyl-tRNA hydrolase [Gaiellaceae bacterium]|nr:Vms1/Ankzf1 family peptidyl-tRNA hydrolase [Gaiellaceae bacterium]
MAGTITWDTLRELAGFRADKGRAVSVYVNLDPSEVPTVADAQTRMRSLISDAERQLAERRASLDGATRKALESDLERIRTWFDADFDRDGARGLAIFAAGLDNFWRPIELPAPIADAARIGDELYLAPLVRQAGGEEGALVAYVGRERGEVFRLRGGRLVAIADRSDEVPGRHDQGGWSQARYERHIEEIVARHLGEVAETLDGCVRRLRGVPIVLAGPEGSRPDFEAMLATETRSCLAGWTTAEAHADAQQLLAAARPLLDAWRADRDRALLERWREEAAKAGRAATGWDETLEAASDGRVDLLLVQDGADRPAYRCPACGRAATSDGACPLDGTSMEGCPNGLDLAVHQTLNHGGTVHVVGEEQRDLEPVGGVAALLRF